MLGHLDGPRIANSYIRMGYAGLGSAIAGALALWLLGSYRADGFAWSSRPAALVTVVVVGPVMLVAYLLLLRVFHVTELRDLMRPLMGRFGRGAPAVAGAAAEPTTAARATVSDDTGLIPRISGEFDAASFRAGPALEPEPAVEAPAKTPHFADTSRSEEPHAKYLPDEDVPGTARGGRFHPQVPLPGRRTYQGEPGQNPYFPADGDVGQHARQKRKK